MTKDKSDINTTVDKLDARECTLLNLFHVHRIVGYFVHITVMYVLDSYSIFIYMCI